MILRLNYFEVLVVIKVRERGKSMDINYDLYKIFYHVALNGSFTIASEKLYVSQSAVTQSVKKLEGELGRAII